MTTTKQSWFKRSLAVLLAIMMVMSMGMTNALAAEKTTAEKYAELHAYASTLKEEDYTEESWAEFEELWSAINSISDVSGLSEETQENFLSRLETAINGLEKVSEQSNYQKYLTLIEQAESLESSLFTEESWSEFSNALESEKSDALVKAQQEFEEKGDIDNSYISNFETKFLLLYFKEAKVLTDEETGIQVISYNYDMRNAATLEITTYDESNWPYTVEGAWNTNIALSSTTYSAFKILIKDDQGNTVDTLRKFEIKISIPEKFDLTSLNVKLAQKSGASYKPTYEIDEINRTVTVSVSNSLAKYSNGMIAFFYNPIDTIDVSTLSNGVYQVNVDLVKHSDSSVSSMADGTLEPNAILVKSDNGVDVYLSFVPIDYLGAPAYTGGLWCEVGEKADGKLDEDSMTVLSYYCNADGTLMDNSIYDAVTEVACVKQIKLSLSDDCKNDNGGYTLAVSSPTMAAINNLPFEEIIRDELLVNLLISNPESLGTLEFAQEYIPLYEKSALLKEIEYAKVFSEEDYTADSFSKLAEAVTASENVYDAEYQDKATASAVYENQIKMIRDAIFNLEESTELTDAKESLQEVIDSAKAIEIGNKTENAYIKLQEVISASEKVLNSITSDINDIVAAKDALEAAVAVFNSSEDATTISKDNLSDGVYSIYVDMVKMDRISKSMADNAINHTVKLEVINGEYYITLDFKGITIENRFGYLMDLSYYDDGYSYGDYGTVTGSLVAAEVLTTQKDSNGDDVIDQYNDANHLYPDIVKIKLGAQAIEDEDGYVPLHVFVPIMEAIAEGNGDQDVLMKIDWSTLKATTEDDPDFQPEEPVEQSPAINVTDPTTGIKVEADKGVFPEGVEQVVTQITSGADYDRAASILSDVGKKFRLFEIHFELDGAEIQPNGIVTVYYPIPEGYDADKVVLYRINEDGTKTLVKGTVENGFYKVMTKSFSTYALVEQGSTITDAENSANVGSDIPQTGDSTNVLPFALLALASGGMIGVLFISRKRKTVK